MQKNVAEQGTNKDSKHDTTPVKPLLVKKPDKTGAWATASQMSVHQDSLWAVRNQHNKNMEDSKIKKRVAC